MEQLEKYWHVKDPNSTEIEVSEGIAGLVRMLQPELVLETGTYRGQTAALIGKALKENGHGRLITLESSVAFLSDARYACKDLPVEIVRCLSTTYELPAGSKIDLLYLDSTHAEERLQELKHFKRWMPCLWKTIILVTDMDRNAKASIPYEQLAAWPWKWSRLPTPNGLYIGEVA